MPAYHFYYPSVYIPKPSLTPTELETYIKNLQAKEACYYASKNKQSLHATIRYKVLVADSKENKTFHIASIPITAANAFEIEHQSNQYLKLTALLKASQSNLSFKHNLAPASTSGKPVNILDALIPLSSTREPSTTPSSNAPITHKRSMTSREHYLTTEDSPSAKKSKLEAVQTNPKTSLDGAASPSSPRLIEPEKTPLSPIHNVDTKADNVDDTLESSADDNAKNSLAPPSTYDLPKLATFIFSPKTNEDDHSIKTQAFHEQLLLCTSIKSPPLNPVTPVTLLPPLHRISASMPASLKAKLAIYHRESRSAQKPYFTKRLNFANLQFSPFFAYREPSLTLLCKQTAQTHPALFLSPLSQQNAFLHKAFSNLNHEIDARSLDYGTQRIDTINGEPTNSFRYLFSLICLAQEKITDLNLADSFVPIAYLINSAQRFTFATASFSQAFSNEEITMLLYWACQTYLHPQHLPTNDQVGLVDGDHNAFSEYSKYLYGIGFALHLILLCHNTSKYTHSYPALSSYACELSELDMPVQVTDLIDILKHPYASAFQDIRKKYNLFYRFANQLLTASLKHIAAIEQKNYSDIHLAISQTVDDWKIKRIPSYLTKMNDSTCNIFATSFNTSWCTLDKFCSTPTLKVDESLNFKLTQPFYTTTISSNYSSHLCFILSEVIDLLQKNNCANTFPYFSISSSNTTTSLKQNDIAQTLISHPRLCVRLMRLEALSTTTIVENALELAVLYSLYYLPMKDNQVIWKNYTQACQLPNAQLMLINLGFSIRIIYHFMKAFHTERVSTDPITLLEQFLKFKVNTETKTRIAAIRINSTEYSFSQLVCQWHSFYLKHIAAYTKIHKRFDTPLQQRASQCVIQKTASSSTSLAHLAFCKSSVKNINTPAVPVSNDEPPAIRYHPMFKELTNVEKQNHAPTASSTV